MSYKPKILLVEDEPQIRFLIKRMLEFCEVDIITAKNGFGAIEVCNNEKIQMILMDIRMPGMNGYEASAKIKSDLAANCDVPIIAITAAICNGEIHYGIDGCIEKPFDSSKLYETINRHLGTVCRI